MGSREQTRETVLRTFRLDKDTVSGLEDVAREKHTSPNNLVNLLLRDYLQWGFYYEARGSLWISKRTFTSLLDYLSEQEIQELATNLHTNAKEMALLKSGNWDLQSYLALSGSSKYSGGAYNGGAHSDFKRDGRNYTIIIHHDLGPKYSLFLKTYHGAILSQFADGDVKTEVSDGTIVFQFRSNEQSS